MEFFGVFLALMGAYILYAAIIMKTQGKITKSIMMNQNRHVGQIKDKEGFINYMFLRTFFMGVVVIAAGIWSLLGLDFANSWIVDLAITIFFTIIVVLYLLSIRSADKKFF